MNNESETPPVQTQVSIAPPQPAQSSSTLAAMMPVKNMPALIGYYLGVFGLIPFIGFPLAIAAIVLGVIGLNKEKKQSVPGGKAHATVALSLGIFEVVCFVGFFAFFALVR